MVTKLREQATKVATKVWSQRWQTVVLMHDVQGMTFQAIGDQLGFTKARAHQLYKKAKRNGGA